MFSFQGIVGRGNQRGKGLGFPTANIPLAQKIPEGIYLSQVRHDGTMHNALTFVGPAKT
jgi:riboflavin kinase/FMN adenylyltransferase